MRTPERIICLTEETVETLYLLGEGDRIVGISGYTVRPPEARRDKPKVSAFTSAKIDKILELAPDLVLTFSDLQADIVADLIRRGVEVHAFNQRDVAGILDMIGTLGRLVGVIEMQAGAAGVETGAGRERHRQGEAHGDGRVGGRAAAGQHLLPDTHRVGLVGGDHAGKSLLDEAHVADLRVGRAGGEQGRGRRREAQSPAPESGPVCLKPVTLTWFAHSLVNAVILNAGRGHPRFCI